MPGCLLGCFIYSLGRVRLPSPPDLCPHVQKRVKHMRGHVMLHKGPRTAAAHTHAHKRRRAHIQYREARARAHSISALRLPFWGRARTCTRADPVNTPRWEGDAPTPFSSLSFSLTYSKQTTWFPLRKKKWIRVGGWGGVTALPAAGGSPKEARKPKRGGERGKHFPDLIPP